MTGGAQHYRLSDAQRVAWLRLSRAENVGPATFRDLINHCGSAANALQMLPELTSRGGKKKFATVPSEADAERELEAVDDYGARIVAVGEEDYPPFLRLIDHPPPLVTVKGATHALSGRCISIVGARNASMAGISMARKLAATLGAAGHVIVSGLARGIDKAAHEAALETGTIAVLAGGIDQPYPPENVGLLARIEDDGRGASITEMPFGAVPRARDFPRRNRIIAAMSLGLIVVEAAHRSGSLISARLAGEMGRLVFAVPGSPLDPRSKGTNDLIRNGAVLVTGADDVIEGLAPLDPEAIAVPPRQSEIYEPDGPMAMPPDDDDRSRLTSLLGPSPVPLDELIAQTGLSSAQVALIILELDLAGRIERHSGGMVSLVAGDA